LFNVARIPSWRVAFDQAPATPAGGHQSYVDLLHLGRALASVECLGHAEAALAMTVDYVERRVQFGRPLGTFQAVRHHCANMAIFTSAMRFLVYEAVWALGQGVGTAEQVAIAKAWAGRAAVEVAQTAHQLHGGFGVTEEYDLHFHTLRAKYRSISWGTPTECLATVAAGVDQPRGWL
jgi:alkylation response protein AidB-like acyl-CoA dehydrogenase